MNVRELREALQKLEAEGKGGLEVAYRTWWKDRMSDDEVAELREAVGEKGDSCPLGPYILLL